MKAKHILSFIALFVSLAFVVNAQTSSVTYVLDAELNGSVLQVPSEGFNVIDDGGVGSYSKGRDWKITISNTENACSAPYVLALRFQSFDINPLDTLYVYDGPSTSYPVLIAANNNHDNMGGERTVVYASANNNRNMHTLTVRFKTAVHHGNNSGFMFSVECLRPCETSVPHIDSVFERTRNGVVYAEDVVRSYNNNPAITVCAGDGVRIHAYGEYSHYSDHYNPTDANTTFIWTYDEDEVQQGVGQTYASYSRFDTLGCHQLILELNDANNCPSSVFDRVKILVATNPIRTISNLGTVCQNEELMVLVSYDASNVINIDSIEILNIHTRTNYVKTFIPDGPNCAVRCYSAPVVFSEFRTGQTVASAEDICSVCVNYEHSFMGDYDLAIICPSSRKATLKYKDATGSLPAGAYGGGGIYTGYPYGGSNDSGWDSGCDSLHNMYGIGLDYCFSRNGNYTLVDGQPANTTINGNHYLASSAYIDQVTFTFPPRPAAYRSSGSDDAGTSNFSTKHPSNPANRTDYYKPADDFTSLIGCPLNGRWEIQICDNWASDNGWVFNWSMDLCNITTENDCEYNVGIDSITWDLTPESGRINPTRVRRDPEDFMKFYMSARDTAGIFFSRMHIYDKFGCRWDSTGFFTVLWNPTPELGNDTVFCREGTATFDATDRHANGRGYRFSYNWSNGETTPLISPTANQTTWYKVNVTNMATNGSQTRCVGVDSVAIIVGVHPKADFGPDSLGMLCSPSTIAFQNRSKNSYSYLWDFGDGSSSNQSDPLHTYFAGKYDVTLYAISRDGCRDTLTIPAYAKVFPVRESVYGAMMCNGADYTWIDGITYTEPTTEPKVILTTIDGCDSIVHLNLDIDYNTRARIHAEPAIASHDHPYICLRDYGINSVRRTWWLPDGTVSITDPTCFYFPVDEDSVRIILAIESQYGCTDTTSLVILMDESQVWLPNVFTPNEPNNKYLMIGHNDIDQAECYVYNRSGQLVYQTKNLDQSWDGTYNDKLCPQGVYVVMVRYTTLFEPDRWRTKKSTVLLLR